MTRMTYLTLAATTALLTINVAAATQASSPIPLRIELTPKNLGMGKGTLTVSLTFARIPAQTAKSALLSLPLIDSNVDSAAPDIRDLTATDSLGQVHLLESTRDMPEISDRDSEIGGPSVVWSADRKIVGPLTVSYIVPAHATKPPRGPAPPIGLYEADRATSGAASMFLPLPLYDGKYSVTIHWAASIGSEKSTNVTSLDSGANTISTIMDRAEIYATYMMSGAIQAWTPSGADQDFRGAWQGQPNFDAAALMSWANTLHGHYKQFFNQTASQPYTVFLRYNPINAGGGVGLYHSFVETYGAEAGSDPDELKLTLAHEMFHTFSPYITDPTGLLSSWFGEGLAVFYQAALPFRFHMISADLFLHSINYSAARYYTDIFATSPNSEIPDMFWKDTRIRTLPYDRSMLYFATVDYAMRSKTHNKKSLDTLVLGMLAREKMGKSLSNSDWESLLRENLGEESVQHFRSFLAGEKPVPASAAFGACFERYTTKLRRYELGFEPAVLAEPKRVVRGLVPNSAAAEAGLHNGDIIVTPVPQDQIQGEQNTKINLDILRNGQKLKITYLPRGEFVDVYQWRKIKISR
ncbi:M61 metallopeptidase family protein [Gluconobacter sphaericus]|uniref:Peptidase M61 n=1 Tax=Gluconobacter sphaericus NBRC 12467 TaxID=1307951 RepID=A0AA37W9S5_9PROT|nr:peptidase M61 [Gluconobacter sphaericus]MBF0885855.1 peptidase M61 [Gluconobacter sphaericus]GBR55219.1 peptidase M61 domain-containing protein [Gluconobacter sphaericus NBRC 12467]GEB43911.1 hypothetical protein GSP01_26930 [Gluconobacter sphaericus NBRC 12467]GLQ83154.1 hypothetical protein GCM10007872_00620 [Gluconobacter sphaericus NBRC 12467]